MNPALQAAQRILDRARDEGKVRTVSRDMSATDQRENHWTRLGDTARERPKNVPRPVVYKGNEYATVRALAKAVRLSHTTVYKLIDTGEVRYV